MDKTVILFGSTTLLGKEIQERAKESGLPARLQAAAAEPEASAVLAAFEDEIEVVPVVDAEMVEGADAVAIIEKPEATLALVREHSDSIPVFDVTGALFNEPGAVLRAPIFEARPPAAAIHILPHPAAWLLTQLLNTVHQHQPLKRCVATIFEPASATGQAGIDELQKQTVAMLSFRNPPKNVFDAQLCFNMLARFGEESKESIQAREGRIRRDIFALARLHGEGMPMASIRLIQASTFHAYTASIWLEFADRPDVPALLQQLQQDGVDVRGEDLEPPTNSGVAGQSGYSVGAVEADPNDRHGLWIWLAADNLTVQADLLVDLLREVQG